MKLYDQRISKNISVSSAAFYANFIYILIVMAFALIQQIVNPTGEAYDTFLGIIEFVVATLYWIIIGVVFFSRPGRTKSGTTVTYLVFVMLPITIFTIASVSIVYYFPTTDFQYAWNDLTWIVAPTLFWYLPFSYAYYSLGYYMNIIVFMFVCLVYVFFLQMIGILFGFAWSSHVQEREAAASRQRERTRQRRKRASVSIEEASPEEPIITEPILDDKLFTGTNPFVGTDNGDTIHSEGFNKISDSDLQNAADQKDTNFDTVTTPDNTKLTREEKRALKKKEKEEKRKQKLEQKMKKKQEREQRKQAKKDQDS